MENYLMSSPTQLSHVYLPSENGKQNMDDQYTISLQNTSGAQQNGVPESSESQSSHTTPVHGSNHNDHTNPLAKPHLEGRLSPSVYEDLDFASDLPDFSYDQTISLDLNEERLASHSMIGRVSHAKTFSFDGGALQMPFTLNSGSKFSNFSHSRNVSLDDSNYSRSDMAGSHCTIGYHNGHSHSVSLASNSADPPSGTFSHSISNSTLQSMDSVPQLSSSMSNKSLQDSPYSMVNVYPNNSASTPGRRRLSTSLSTSNIYATPLRGSSVHSPTVKVGKTPLKSHHVRSRSKPSMSIEAGSSQLLASIASMKNLSVPNSAVAPSNMKLPTAPYNVPHSAPVDHTDASNPFESSFISPKIDMNLSDLDATPLATPAKSFSSSHMQNFTPIPHNQSFGGSLNETNLSRLSRIDSQLGRMDSQLGGIDSQLGRMDSGLGRMDSQIGGIDSQLGGMDSQIGRIDSQIGRIDSQLGGMDSQIGRTDSQLGRTDSQLKRMDQKRNSYERKELQPVDSIKIEDQDDDACKQLKRAKSYMAVQDLQRVSLSRAASARSFKSASYSQSASIDLLSPEIMNSDRKELRTALKSYPASIDLAAITKSNHQNNSGYVHPSSYSNYSPEREYDNHEAKDQLLPPIPAHSRIRSHKQHSVSNTQAYPTHSQIQETSTTEEIAKFAEKIMNSDSKRPIVVQEDSDEMHDPKKKHKCPLCLARFQRPEHVKRHLKCHSSEKPFQCDIDDCGRRFNRKDNLKAHLKKIHGKVV